MLSREEMNETQEKLFDTSIFLGKLLALGLVFRSFIFLYPSTAGLQNSLAKILSSLLNFTGFSSTVQGTLILTADATYRITQDCLGWKSIAAFSGLTLASSRIREKWRFLAAGIFLLVLLNIVRVFTTIHLASIDFISYDIIHGTLWKWGLTVAVLALWSWEFVDLDEIKRTFK